MRYQEYEKFIARMAAAASADAQRHFALESLRLLTEFAEPSAQGQLNASEKQLLLSLIEGVEKLTPDVLAEGLIKLSASMCSDDIRAIEFNPDITELTCAIDNWIQFRLSNDPCFIAGIAVNMVNSVAFHADRFDIDDMLRLPEMAAEFKRQTRLLSPTRRMCHHENPTLTVGISWYAGEAQRAVR